MCDKAQEAGCDRVLLGPLDVQDEVVVSKARHPSDGARSILTAVEADEGKALGKEAESGPQTRTGSPFPKPHGHRPTLDWPVVLSFAK